MKHIFLAVFVTDCCVAGRTTTFLLGSAANADMQNASANPTLAHRTDQAHERLSLVFLFMPGL
jgi:hypothetical protein